MSMEWTGDTYVAKVTKAARSALAQGGEMLLTKSKQECPVDTEQLQLSGIATPLDGGKRVEISYNTPYAHRQHEDLTYNHSQGKAKYLEDPMRQFAPAVFELVKRAWSQ